MYFLVFKSLAKKYSRNSRRQTDSSPYPASRKIIQILDYKNVKKPINPALVQTPSAHLPRTSMMARRPYKWPFPGFL